MGNLGLGSGDDNDADDDEIAAVARVVRTEVGRRVRIPNQRYNAYVRLVPAPWRRRRRGRRRACDGQG